jgi:hypothetical protein
VPIIKSAGVLHLVSELKGDVQKVIPRESARPYVEVELYQRRKQGFVPPSYSIKQRGQAYPIAARYFTECKSKRPAVLSGKDMIAILDRCLSLDQSSAAAIRGSFILPERCEGFA